MVKQVVGKEKEKIARRKLVVVDAARDQIILFDCLRTTGTQFDQYVFDPLRLIKLKCEGITGMKFNQNIMSRGQRLTGQGYTNYRVDKNVCTG